MDIDHVVVWVSDVEQSLKFYVEMLGFKTIREKEYLNGEVRFPSVRINDKTILDIMSREALLPLVQTFTGGEAAGGQPINHICLSMTEKQYQAAIQKLNSSGIDLTSGGENVFGAQGQAVRSTYFNDPDGNVLEIRYYNN